MRFKHNWMNIIERAACPQVEKAFRETKGKQSDTLGGY